MSTRLVHVVFDANDHIAQARWWSQALGSPVVGERDDEAWLTPENSPEIIFVPVREPKNTKNRIHLDLATESKEHQDAIVQRVIAMGAERIDIGQPKDASWVVLADLEGNEFCASPPNEMFANTGTIGAISYDESSVALGHFWSEATGWSLAYERGDYVGLRAPDGAGPFITLGPPVARKSGKNRVHLDVAPTPAGDHLEEADRLQSLGARRIDIGQGGVPWVVMADPEDNEFCVLTPR